MSAPNLNLIQYAADHGLLQAQEEDDAAADLERRALEHRKRASVLKRLHEIAQPHAKQSTLDREGT